MTKEDRGILAAIVVVGIALRLVYIDQPMRYDESVTYLEFAAQPWSMALGSYLYPNNHVFHTALVKLSTSVFGNAPWAIRLPAFLFGVATIVLTAIVGRRLVGAGPAMIGAAIVAASGPMVLFSTNARGYTLICVATLLLVQLLLDLRERPSLAKWAGVVVVTTLGMWTMPTMLYPAVGLALWFLALAYRRDTSVPRHDPMHVVVATLATAALTVACYAPILFREGASPLVANGWIKPSTWSAFFAELPAGAAGVLRAWRLGLPLLVAIGLGACTVYGARVAWSHRVYRVPMSLAMAIGCAVVLLATHRVPYARVWIFLLPLAALWAGLGLVTAVSRLSSLPLPSSLRSSGQALRPALLAPALAVVLAFSLVIRRSVLTSRETGTLRDAAAITAYLGPTLKPGDRVVTTVPGNVPLEYAFVRAGLGNSYLKGAPNSAGALYVVVNTGEGVRFEVDSNPAATSVVQPRLLKTFPGAEVYLMAKPGSPK
jgi:4-amino-4-deoxy-L-arabinose transferase-like glycosyltransferase